MTYICPSVCPLLGKLMSPSYKGQLICKDFSKLCKRYIVSILSTTVLSNIPQRSVGITLQMEGVPSGRIPPMVYHYTRDLLGTYIRWYLRNRCARKEQSLLFDLFKAFDNFKANYTGYFFLRKDIFSFMRVNHVLSYRLI